jgi:hypothetical protein
MARSLEHRPEMKGWTAWCGYRRRLFAARLAVGDRRRARMAVGVTNDIDEPLTELSDDLGSFSLEIRK